MEKVETFTDVKTLLGETLPKPIRVEFSFVRYDSYDELVAASKEPSKQEILDMVNADAKISAMANAKNKNADVKKFIDDKTGTAEYRRKVWVENSMKQMGAKADRAFLEAFAAENIQ